VANENINTFKGSLHEPNLRFMYAFFIALLLPLLSNLLSGTDLTSSGYLEISFGYFIFYAIIVFSSYLCVYLAIIKDLQFFKYPLFIIFFITLLAKYQYFSFLLSVVDYSITGLPGILNLFGSLLALISAMLLIYCTYLLFFYKIYFWSKSDHKKNLHRKF